MIESIITIGGALGFEDQVTGFVVGATSLLLAIAGLANPLITAVEKIAQVTPLDADNKYISKARRAAAWLDKLLYKLALRPEKD